MKELIDLRTLAEIEDAAPVVTAVSVRGAAMVTRALDMYADEHDAEADINGQTYWIAKYDDLVKKIGSTSIDEVVLGRIVKAMGLERVRKGDGFYVAWSVTQVLILKKHLGIE